MTLSTRTRPSVGLNCGQQEKWDSSSASFDWRKVPRCWRLNAMQLQERGSFFASFFCIGSASTGSTKSATMELYTSSYNETMSGGGETLSSISEKSCISNPNNQGSGSQAFPTQAYLMVMIIFGAKIQSLFTFENHEFWRENSSAI